MKKFLKFLIPIGLLSFANIVFAQGDVSLLVKEIIDYIITIVEIGAGIIIIIGGYFMITSAGDPQKFEKGKKTLLYGAIGFILVFAAKELAEEIMNLMK
jgi:Na+-transporting NADH:ubiquinone oxidoreductase subunit NqrB